MNAVAFPVVLAGAGVLMLTIRERGPWMPFESTART